MAESSEDDRQNCINYANKLIKALDVGFPRITSIEEVRCCLFIALFEQVTGHAVPVLFLKDDISTDLRLLQSIICQLEEQTTGISLSHISANAIVSGDVNSILNLLEVIEALFLQLPQNEKSKKSTSSKLSHEEGQKLKTSTVTEVKFKKSISSTSSSTDYEENALLQLNTSSNKSSLQISRAAGKKISEAMTKSPYYKSVSAQVDNVKSPIRKTTMPKAVKQPSSKNLEELCNSNFETKVKLLLQSDLSPSVRAQQLKKNYLKTLDKPVKRTFIAPCKKSFLVTSDLRCKSKTTFQQSQSGLCRKDVGKTSISKENSTKSKEVPDSIKSILKEFPGFQIADSTTNYLKEHYYQHLDVMHKQLKDIVLKKPLTLTQRELQEHKGLEKRMKSSFRDALSQSVRIRQYFDEFQKSICQIVQKRNISQEIKIQELFMKVLELQNKKLRLLCDKVKEADGKHHSKHLSCLKYLFEQQLASLAVKDQENSSLRNNEQRLGPVKSNQEMYKSLKKEERSLQKDIVEMMYIF